MMLPITAKEYHVSKSGNDKNPGTNEAPFLTIQAAADIAHAGDVITVHEGIYREWVNPQFGGLNDSIRIIYRAAPGETVEIKGSEVITGWEKVNKGIWKVEIPHSFFGDYNPFNELLQGDWFYPMGRVHHPGDVYLNGVSFYEEVNLDVVISSDDTKTKGKLGRGYTWFCENKDGTTIIWANFHKYNPNKEIVEISVRHTCFYPDKPNLNYITVRGFKISQAATRWPAPTAEQIGMVSTHWNKGWIIENNKIHDTRCSGITLGKERTTGNNIWKPVKTPDDPSSYMEVIFKALRHGWNEENIGSHIVRNNEIYNCEQAGICGSFGAAFSLIENNHIHHVYTKRQFNGSELAGVKFHAPIDVIVRNNRIHNCIIGLFFDWMTQGTRVSQNLLYENDKDIYFEVNHGPYLVDNNLLLSRISLINQSNGGAFVHNLFTGEVVIWAERSRFTPYHLPHSTDIAGISLISSGDNRFYNNIFVGIGVGKGVNEVGINNYGLSTFNDSLQHAWGALDKAAITVASFINNNVYLNGAVPYKNENQFLVHEEIDPNVSLTEEEGGVFLEMNLEPQAIKIIADYITTAILGKTRTSKANFENPDESSIVIDFDYFGNRFLEDDILAGPFSENVTGRSKIKVWKTNNR